MVGKMFPQNIKYNYIKLMERIKKKNYAKYFV